MYANIITKQQLFIVKICKYSMPLFLDLCSVQLSFILAETESRLLKKTFFFSAETDTKTDTETDIKTNTETI